MPFPFTFKLSVPGMSNPFARHSLAGLSTTKSPIDNDRSGELAGRQSRRRTSVSPAVPLSRKRGWVPSVPDASVSTSTFTSNASGYLAPPSTNLKCSHMAVNRDESHTAEAMIAELPPAKRRRTFAGSVVSAALNAALVGTAVGLTVYRLWRNRGKETEQLPPPPYQQGEWTPELLQQPQQQTIEAPAPSPATRSRKTRQSHTPSSVKRLNTHRRPRIRAHAYSPPPFTGTPALLSAPQPEFDFRRHVHGEEIPVEDQMDWIGDKLTMLIQEGQKALGREVVVMSDAQEDEVDDGMGVWEEEAAHNAISQPSSPRRAKRPHNIGSPASPSYPSPPLTSSPRTIGFSHSQPSSYSAGLPITPPRTTRGVSVDSFSSFREDERAWESPELRESMERARARFLRNQVA